MQAEVLMDKMFLKLFRHICQLPSSLSDSLCEVIELCPSVMSAALHSYGVYIYSVITWLLYMEKYLNQDNVIWLDLDFHRCRGLICLDLAMACSVVYC